MWYVVNSRLIRQNRVLLYCIHGKYVISSFGFSIRNYEVVVFFDK
jgi:hypothetical protein